MADDTMLSKEERAAVRARAKELKLQATREGQAQSQREAIGALSGDERRLADRISAMVEAAAPSLHPKTYYGMPGWANEDDKIVCFFQPATKFNVRYSTFGFDTVAALDDGDMWATSFALLKLSDADEQKLAALVRRAAS
ncbi:MAG: hypothetical protein AB7K08_06360 [Microbacteriaceae bacterium]